MKKKTIQRKSRAGYKAIITRKKTFKSKNSAMDYIKKNSKNSDDVSMYKVDDCL